MLPSLLRLNTPLLHLPPLVFYLFFLPRGHQVPGHPRNLPFDLLPQKRRLQRPPPNLTLRNSCELLPSLIFESPCVSRTDSHPLFRPRPPPLRDRTPARSNRSSDTTLITTYLCNLTGFVACGQATPPRRLFKTIFSPCLVGLHPRTLRAVVPPLCT